MKWLISSVQKDNTMKENKFKVGATLKHKATGSSATILNYYANTYIVEMERNDDNQFKRQVIALKEDKLTSDFLPQGKAKEDKESK